MFAFVAFLIALIIFVVRALGGDIDADWGFVALAAGLVLAYLPDLPSRRP
jgi:hypothetical protein